MSCIVLYHTALSAYDIGAVVKFFDIFSQSDCGDILAIRISSGVKDALCIFLALYVGVSYKPLPIPILLDLLGI